MSTEIIDSSIFKKTSSLQAKVHAKRIDKFLGFKIPRIEVKLLQKYRAFYQRSDDSNKKKHYTGTQTWIGLHPQVLQTPYYDLYDALEAIQPYGIDSVVDIGAGYGRVGIVASSLFPKVKFIGFEILKKRTEEANRVFELHGLSNCTMNLQNVLADNFVLPYAKVYFIYDFSEVDDICKILDTLNSRLSDEKFFLITKGERIDFLIKRKYKNFWIPRGFLGFNELKVYSSYIDFKQE